MENSSRNHITNKQISTRIYNKPNTTAENKKNQIDTFICF